MLKRILLWDYARASWQYDVIVGAILAFIFITPRSVFRDQPKAPGVAIVRDGFWIETQQMEGVPTNELARRATQLVNARFKTKTAITVVEPIYDEAEQELKGYLAFPAK